MIKGLRAYAAAVMTLHRLGAGDGYTYLTRQTASNDALRGRLGGWCLSPRGGPPISMIVLGEWP